MAHETICTLAVGWCCFGILAAWFLDLDLSHINMPWGLVSIVAMLVEGEHGPRQDWCGLDNMTLDAGSMGKKAALR